MPRPRAYIIRCARWGGQRDSLGDCDRMRLRDYILMTTRSGALDAAQDPARVAQPRRVYNPPPRATRFELPRPRGLGPMAWVRDIGDTWTVQPAPLLSHVDGPRAPGPRASPPSHRVHVAGPTVPLVARATVGGAHAHRAPAAAAVAEERGRQSKLGGDLEVLALQCGAGDVITS